MNRQLQTFLHRFIRVGYFNSGERVLVSMSAVNSSDSRKKPAGTFSEKRELFQQEKQSARLFSDFTSIYPKTRKTETSGMENLAD